MTETKREDKADIVSPILCMLLMSYQKVNFYKL